MIHILRGRLAWVKKSEIGTAEINRLRDIFTLYPSNGADYGDVEGIIHAYEENTEYFGFPREAVNHAFGGVCAHTIEDKTVIGKKVSFKVKVPAWTNQKKPIENIVKKLRECGGTILKAPCGSGKTNIALLVAAKIAQPTIVFVHKSFLMNQWKDRIKEVLGIDCGIIQQDKCDYKKHKITVAMVQSLASRDDYPEEMFRHFGLVIVDENHRMGCTSHDFAIRKFPARYKYGLSATQYRKDGMDCLFKWHLGNIDTVIERKNNVTGTVYQVRMKKAVNLYKYQYGKGKTNFSKMISDTAALEERQNYIAGEIRKMYEAGRKILVLSDRKAHLNDFEDRLKRMDINDYGYYVGAMKEKDLKESATRAILLGTYQMCSEAFDAPELDTVILTTPKSDIEQAVGRIERECEGKKPLIVIDIVDPNPMFKHMANKRARQYTEIMNFDIKQIQL